MKILIISSNLDQSTSSSIQLKSLINNFTQKEIYYYSYTENFDIHTTSDYHKYKDRFKDNKINIKNSEINKISEVEKKLSNKEFDFILGWSNPYCNSTIAIALGEKSHTPVILRLGDFYISEYSKNKLIEYLKAKYIVVPNFALRKTVIDFYGEKHKDKIKVISQHYDDNNLEKNQLNIKNNTTNIIHAGNCYQERKIDNLIKSLGEVEEKNKVNIIFVGSHEKLDEDKQLCKKYNIKADFSNCYQFENWNFEKSLSFEETRKLIVLADILLHLEYCSISNHFLSFKLIDYLSYSKPIITITQKNSPNFHLSQECGFAFADINENDHLCKNLVDVINNPKKYIPNSNRLNYHIKNVIKKWESLINEL